MVYEEGGPNVASYSFNHVSDDDTTADKTLTLDQNCNSDTDLGTVHYRLEEEEYTVQYIVLKIQICGNI